MARTEQIGEQSWRMRYICATRKVASIGGFASKDAADCYALVMEAEQRRGVWADPMRGRMPLAEWASVWFGTLDVDQRTRENYISRLRRHILPRWGATRLGDISTLQITAWITALHNGGYARATISGIVKLLSMMLTDAVDDEIIPFNPVRRRRSRRGKLHMPHDQPLTSTCCRFEAMVGQNLARRVAGTFPGFDWWRSRAWSLWTHVRRPGSQRWECWP